MSLLGSQLDAFIAVVKCKTVHAAAEELSLTQTAVTQRIKALEIKLKTTLFTRSRRGMALTKEGEALLHYCQGAQQLEGQVMAQIQGDAAQIVVNVVITGPSSVMRSRVIPDCIKLQENFEQLRFQFDMQDTESRHKTLKEGLSDFAILEPQDVANEMSSKKLAPEEYILVAPKSWKNRPLKQILSQESMVDFNPADTMTIQYLNAFDLAENINADRHFANRTDAVASLVMNEMGYSTLTKEYAAPFVEKGEMIVLNQGKTFQHSLSLAWYERPEPPAYFAAIIEHLN